MNIELTKELVEAVGVNKLKVHGVDQEKIRWSSTFINLQRLPIARIRELQTLLEPHKALPKARVKSALRDIAIWLEAAKVGAANVKCKNTKQFASLVFEYLQKAPDNWLYKKDPVRDVWTAYYVGSVYYEPKKVSRDGVIPAKTTLRCFYNELGEQGYDDFHWSDRVVSGCTVPEVLLQDGLLIQTPNLRAEYDLHLERYIAFHDKIGKQFNAVGLGTDNLDGNGQKKDRWYSHSVKTIRMAKEGQPGRVVVDVIDEEDGKKNNNDSKNSFSHDFWRGKSYLDEADEEGDSHDDEVIEPDDVDEDDSHPVPNVPVFPIIPCFDLRRHLRLRIHVGNLTEYVYNPSLGDKLILPTEDMALVKMLVSHTGGFQDIIGGKGGGAIVMCAGSPGTGKTLTSEVYAEVMGRALYSVQASQLGLTAEDLEGELLKVFARAQRWGAILLIDEADVYVAARGSNLTQNAIVGVFLRVLEYYSGVLFLTTNRADLVDDAISSRCVARINYGTPPIDNQKKIWRILADVMQIEVSDDLITKFTGALPNMSGRDIKNLLKLAKMVSLSYKQPVSLEMIQFVKRFKPTQDLPALPESAK